MRLTIAAFAATLAMGLGITAAYADGSACASACSAEKSACSEAKKVANKEGGCASSCSSENVAMAKGGADSSTVVSGYGLGQRVPNFSLADTTGKTHNLSDYSGKVVVLVFYNQACPYVVEVVDRLSDFTRKYEEKGVKVLAIDAGADKPVSDIAKHAEGVPYTILVNQTSEVARDFQATRTPEVFILDKEGVVAYHGAFDSGAKGVKEGNLKTYAADAVDALLKGERPEVSQTRAFGCTIKFAKTTTAAAETTM
jgi:peroxiredoxin